MRNHSNIKAPMYFFYYAQQCDVRYYYCCFKIHILLAHQQDLSHKMQN